MKYTQEDLINTLKTTISKEGVIYSYLMDEWLQPILGNNEFERGVSEGKRRLASYLISLVDLNQVTKEIEIDTNIERNQ